MRMRDSGAPHGSRSCAPKGLLQCLSYYLPNISGLTLAAAEVARVVRAQGHEARILTSRPAGHPSRETIDGVEVCRARTIGRLGKAPLMPFLLVEAARAMHGMSVVAIHLPNADAALLAIVARARGRRVLLHYHCSMSTNGFADRLMRAIAALPHMVAGVLAHSIQVVSPDYAAQSVFCRLFRRKLRFAPPPIPGLLMHPLAERLPRQPDSPLRIAFVGRLARQKSLILALQAFNGLSANLGRPVTFDLIGPSEGIVGETDWQSVLKLTREDSTHVHYLGPKSLQELCKIYAQIDLLVLPSTNRQESFGLVQVEAMIQGSPVVAFDLPGVREPVRQTGMGLLATPGSARDLRRVMAQVLTDGPPQMLPPQALQRLFGPDISCAPYLDSLQNRPE